MDRSAGHRPRSLARVVEVIHEEERGTRSLFERAFPPAGAAAVTAPERDSAVEVRLRDGRTLAMRAIRVADADKLQAAIRRLSPDSRYSRFFSALRELPPRMLERATHPDGRHELQLVAVVGSDADEEIVAGARYASTAEGGSCEFAVAVVDEWQGLGVGRALLETLLRQARAHGFESMEGYILATNQAMLDLANRLGFARVESPEGPNICLVRRDLGTE
jgi:GNAT superfamily N-acetyltransferase